MKRYNNLLVLQVFVITAGVGVGKLGRDVEVVR